MTKKTPPTPKRKPTNEKETVARGNRVAKMEAEADLALMKKSKGYKKGGKIKKMRKGGMC